MIYHRFLIYHIPREKRLFRRITVIFGEPYYPAFSGRKPTPEEYKTISEDLLKRIYALGEAAE